MLYLILMAFAFVCAVLAAMGISVPYQPPIRLHLGWLAAAFAILALLLSGTGIR